MKFSCFVCFCSFALLSVDVHAQQNDIQSAAQSALEKAEEFIERNVDTSPEGETLTDDRQEAENQAVQNPFSISQHRLNYLLPVSYTTQANTITVDGLNNANVDPFEAKFQISLKLPVYLSKHDKSEGLMFAFTGTSFWQVYNTEVSKPFRETNYQPELFYQWAPDWEIFGLRFTGAQLGFNHMSNGQDQFKSRSWDRIVGRIEFSSKQASYYLKTWYRLPEDDKDFPLDPNGDDNPDILDFYGRMEIGFVYDFGGVNLLARVRNNLSFSDNRSGIELNVFYPINPHYNLMLQYFDGYGDSLIDYNVYLRRLSIGVSLRFL